MRSVSCGIVSSGVIKRLEASLCVFVESSAVNDQDGAGSGGKPPLTTCTALRVCGTNCCLMNSVKQGKAFTLLVLFFGGIKAGIGPF